MSGKRQAWIRISTFVLFTLLIGVSTATGDPGQWTYLGGPIGGMGYDVRIAPSGRMYVTDSRAGVGISEDMGARWRASNLDMALQLYNIDPARNTPNTPIDIFSLTIDPNAENIIWAGTDANAPAFGIFRSMDAGRTWRLMVNGVHINEGTVYEIDTLQPYGLTFRGFTVMPGNSNIVFAMAEVKLSQTSKRTKGRVYRSNNMGEDWQMIWEGDNLARYLVIDPTDTRIMYLSTGIFDRKPYYFDDSKLVKCSGMPGVLKTEDGGHSWTSLYNEKSGLNDPFVSALRMHPTNNKVLFAATGVDDGYCPSFAYNTANLGLYMTGDGGENWVHVISGEMINTVNFSPSNPSIMYAAGPDAFYRSENGGLNWERMTRAPGLNGWGPYHHPVSGSTLGGWPIDVVVHPQAQDVVYVNNYTGGVMKSTNGGMTWETSSNGFTGSQIVDVHIQYLNKGVGPEYNVLVAGRSGPFVSQDRGHSWMGLSNFDVLEMEWGKIATNPVEKNIVLLSPVFFSYIYFSEDWANTFRMATITQPPSTPFRSIVISPADPAVVYAGVGVVLPPGFANGKCPGAVIYKSTDYGLTFAPVSSNIDGQCVGELVVDPDEPDTLFAATFAGIMKTKDGGKTWENLTFKSFNQNVKAMALDVDFKPQNERIVASILGRGIFVSFDGGGEWENGSAGLGDVGYPITAVKFHPLNQDILAASNLFKGVFISYSSGRSWAPLPDQNLTGLYKQDIRDLEITPDSIYAASFGNGVYRFDF